VSVDEFLRFSIAPIVSVAPIAPIAELPAPLRRIGQYSRGQAQRRKQHDHPCPQKFQALQ
jgi:hypothetical protein